jgi:predicted AAA+ superfamily ATPase
MRDFGVFNPWWKGKEYISDDKHIREYEAKKIKWRPRLLEEIKLKPNNIFTLRGPRQVGKTTLVKLLIRALLEQKKKEKSIFFWNCEEVLDFKELLALIREYLEFAKQNRLQESYIFLDEVSRIKDWQRAVKSVVDSGELENCCLLVTGSHTLDIKYGSELLPGRIGKEGKDFLLLPMSFREFVGTLKPEILKKVKKLENLSQKEVVEKSNNAKPFNSELKTLFSQYLITGGFPLGMNEFFTSSKIPDYIYDIYLRWIVGDIVKWGKAEKLLIQIMRAVISKQTTPISFYSLSKEAEVKSHKTMSAYIEALENMFVLKVLYFLELDKKIPNFNKNKKIYLTDPFIFHVFNNLLFLKQDEISPALVEAVVISHIARFYDNVFYWKNKKEVDALVKTKKDLTAFEIKFQSRISNDDWRGLYYFRRGFLITKDFEQIKEKYSAISAHVFLSLLE